MHLVSRVFSKVVAHASIVALDFCAGAFLAVFWMIWEGVEPTFLLVLIGGIVGVLPDMLDIWTQFKKTGHEVDHHLEWTHFPLVVIPVGMAMGYGIGGLLGMKIFGTSLLFHYIHDMTGPYGGIVVFGPFLKFMFGINGREPLGKSKREIYIRTNGHDHWIKNYWLRASKLSTTELALASMFAVGTAFFDKNSWWIVALSATSWICITLCWKINRAKIQM